ncbi:c-type cytochrome [Acidobacteria bacterium AB60]|nr:c-type cytochrome [Acidobacteria bacterium AB60]
MLKFLGGLAAALLLILIVGFAYVRLGLFDPRADIAVGSIESRIAMPSLDAAVDRRAGNAKNPLQPTEATLVAASKVYQANCASCHGDIRRTHAPLAESLYPRAPQFLEDTPDMPENQNYYIIEHGVRLTGMPAWKNVLSEEQVWQLTTLLSHIDKLPPQVSDAWKAAAGAAPVADAEMKGTMQARQEMPMR